MGRRGGTSVPKKGRLFGVDGGNASKLSMVGKPKHELWQKRCHEVSSPIKNIGLLRPIVLSIMHINICKNEKHPHMCIFRARAEVRRHRGREQEYDRMYAVPI